MVFEASFSRPLVPFRNPKRSSANTGTGINNRTEEKGLIHTRRRRRVVAKAVVNAARRRSTSPVGGGEDSIRGNTNPTAPPNGRSTRFRVSSVGLASGLSSSCCRAADKTPTRRAKSPGGSCPAPRRASTARPHRSATHPDAPAWPRPPTARCAAARPAQRCPRASQEPSFAQARFGAQEPQAGKLERLLRQAKFAEQGWQARELLSECMHAITHQRLVLTERRE